MPRLATGGAEGNDEMKENEELIINRVSTCYEYLVDETGNKETLFDEKKDKMLSFLLDVFEFLQGNQEENPIEGFFE